MARRQGPANGPLGGDEPPVVLGRPGIDDESIEAARPRAAFFVPAAPALTAKQAAPTKTAEAAPRRGKRAVTDDDLIAYLRDLDASALIDLVLEEMNISADFKRRLTLKVATRSGPRDGGPSVATLRKLITSATLAGRHIDSRKAKAYAARLDEVVGALRALFETQSDRKTALAVVDLLSYAIGRLDEARWMVSDSSGRISGILQQLIDLHLRAVDQARPDPKGLAAFLFERRMHSSIPEFDEYRETYGSFLGEEGLAEFRRLAEAEWEKVPVRDASKTGFYYADSSSFRITSIMEQLARDDGNVEEWVAVKTRNLSLVRTYVEIAEFLRNADRPDEALDWAERGRLAFPESQDRTLTAFLAEEYRRRGRHDEALQLLRNDFRRTLRLETYVVLIEYLRGRNDAALLAAERDAALDRLKSHPSHSLAGELIRIYLWEDDLSAALAEAMVNSVPVSGLMDLADRLSATQPENAIGVLEKAIDSSIRVGTSGYHQAVAALVAVRKLYEKLNRQDDWEAYIAEIRQSSKRRSGLMNQLDLLGS